MQAVNNTAETNQKPFYLDNSLQPICVERAEKLNDKIFAYECVLETVASFPVMLELLTNYTNLGADMHGKTLLTGLTESSKIYHLFANEQFQRLKQAIKKETAKK